MGELLVPALVPLVVLVAAALVALVLEAAGTPVGARKRGTRGYLVVIACCAAAAAAILLVRATPTDVPRLLVFDMLTRRSALLVVLLLFVALVSSVAPLRAALVERGELVACMLLVAVGELAVVYADDLMLAFSGMALSLVAGLALLVVERRDGRAVEAAVKHVVTGGAMLALLALGLALVLLETRGTDVSAVSRATGAGALLVVVVLLEGALAFPLHVARVDVLTGAPSFAGALLVGGRAIAATTLLARLVDAGLAGPAAHVIAPLAVLGLVFPGLVAVDQREIPRAAAHLVVGHMAIAVALLAAPSSEVVVLAPIAAFVAALAALGASVLFSSVPPVRRGLSWELFCGVGRTHPRFALALVALLGATAIAPLLPGLPLRLAAADSAAKTSPWLAFAVVAGAPLLALTPLRLALFLFGKTREARSIEPTLKGSHLLPLSLILAALLALGAAFSMTVDLIDRPF